MKTRLNNACPGEGGEDIMKGTGELKTDRGGDV